MKLRELVRAPRFLVALGAGIAGFLFTGWVIFGVTLSVSVMALPWLLATPPHRDIETLEALDRWVRSLARARAVS